VCYSRHEQKAVLWSQMLRHTAPSSSLHRLPSRRNINKLNFPWGMFRATSEPTCVPTYGFVAAKCKTRFSGGLCGACQLLQRFMNFSGGLCGGCQFTAVYEFQWRLVWRVPFVTAVYELQWRLVWRVPFVTAVYELQKSRCFELNTVGL